MEEWTGWLGSVMVGVVLRDEAREHLLGGKFNDRSLLLLLLLLFSAWSGLWK